MSENHPADCLSSHVTIVGGESLGRRVGLLWAIKGGSVTVVDSKSETAQAALQWIESKLPDQIKTAGRNRGRLTAETEIRKAVQGAWLVVECLSEIPGLKIDLFGELDRWCDSTTIITTASPHLKSSTLIGKVGMTGRRRILNTFYLGPPEPPPVELMSCGYTDQRIIERLAGKMLEVGLDPVIAMKQSTGLISNRIWAALARETMMVLADGIGSPEDIDKLFRHSFQARNAPCDLMERMGLKSVCDIEQHYIKERGSIPTYPMEYLRDKCATGGSLVVPTDRSSSQHSLRERSSRVHKRSNTLREQLIGAWELMNYSAFKQEDPSDRIYPGGKDMQGIIMYTQTGYMSAQLQEPGQRPFAQGNPTAGTQAELAESAKRYLAYTGPFYIDESGDEPVLLHYMASCTFPNWLGSTQRRLIKMEDKGEDTLLTLVPEEQMEMEGGKRVLELVWRRLPDNFAERP